MPKKNQKYTDFANVETQRNFLTSEEFPEGSYGNSIGKEKAVSNKDTPWQEGQQYYSNFAYENRNLHAGLPRQEDGAHPTHDDQNRESEDPYNEAPNKANSQME
ncbi:hypothetical protein [Halobacillus karajensis]|uniref:Cytosolic protein n=1 Tax=Halobacillus karajensis TaxID=195088 RepID=A0A024P7V5_9BACI|nr:hypothetical protein [Halobacillus karajensis]CDQ20143.1 hypothetical protein BN982_02460 [Halobacillus karajensis]CDQ25194.1 hypothetical protein BN983_03505 [Halobacillus karajensis]CDQ28445.1 hypothetical protein BN981_02747 [Halobacillus karajensis]